ncbi:MAG: hypothetical protein Kow0074_12930 [Candidatus Zixiibacteriota bacterium]
MTSIGFWVGLAAAGLIVSVPCFATDSIFFDPASITVSETDTFEIEISVDELTTGIHCFRFHLDFNRSNIHLIDITEGPLLPSEGSTFFFWKDTSGIYDVFDCILSPTNAAATGPGVLATVRFTTGMTPCSSPLEFPYLILQDIDLDSLSVTIVEGEIIVDGCCDCPFQADLDANRFRDAVDLNLLINDVFFNGPNDQDPSCPARRSDFNFDGFEDTIDLNELIDHIFFGGPDPVDPCLLPAVSGGTGVGFDRDGDTWKE